jgi:uncharacterized protein (DUF2267 family)
MSPKNIQVFERTAHETHEWINELTDRLEWSSERDVLRMLRTVLAAIRDHLPVNEMAQFSAQLPIMLRGMFFEGWQPKNTPVSERHVLQLVDRVTAQVGDVAEYRGVDDIACVFKLLNNRISAGEINDVRANLPQALRDMWPQP